MVSKSMVQRANEITIDRAHTEKVGGYVYLVDSGMGIYKIGITKDLKKRMEALTVSSPLPLRYVLSIPLETIEDAKSLEYELFDKFRSKWVKGEWYRLGWDDIDYIMGLAK